MFTSLQVSDSSRLFHGCARVQSIARLLPGAAETAAAAEEDVEEIAVTDVDVDAMKERARLMRAEESDDDDMPRGAQRVQCAQQ